MQSLVTGASGYIGCNLVLKMSEKGMKTRALVRKTSNIQRLLGLKNVEICYGDITDFSSLEQAVKGCQVVFHTAALINDWGYYQKFYKVNYLGTWNILQASIKEKVKRFIHISSIGALNLKGRGIIREDHPYGHFTSSYFRSKAEAEKLVRKYSDVIPAVIIRPPAVYGPEDFLLSGKASNLARKKLLFVIERGKGIFPHLYIDNLIQAILLAAQKEGAGGEIFNITDGVDTSALEFFNHFNHTVGKGDINLSLPYPLAWILAFLLDIYSKLTGRPPLLSWTALEFLTLKCRFDISKAREKLGYRPTISLKEGMKRVKLWWDSINLSE